MSISEFIYHSHIVRYFDCFQMLFPITRFLRRLFIWSGSCWAWGVSGFKAVGDTPCCSPGRRASLHTPSNCEVAASWNFAPPMCKGECLFHLEHFGCQWFWVFLSVSWPFSFLAVHFLCPLLYWGHGEVFNKYAMFLNLISSLKNLKTLYPLILYEVPYL